MSRDDALAPVTARVRRALQDRRARAARKAGFDIIRPRTDAMGAQHQDLPPALRRMKLDALSRHEELVALAVDRMRENGIRVHRAATAREAVRAVLGALPRPGLLVKSKTNMGKELHLVRELEAAGHTVVETDLGDRINQLAGVEGYHVLAPAVSVGRGRIRELFSREVGEELSDDTAGLVAAARRSLRRLLEEADYGLTGANAIAADTGAVCLMENEGNIRMVTALPAVHVVVAGIHKVVPTLDDAVEVIRGASTFGAGQLFGNYLSCISGPGDGVAGPAEMHVVLVDGGRSRAIAAGWAEAFACLNCGACLNNCPVYAVVGDAWAGTRAGGIGSLQTAVLDGPAAGDLDGASLCIGCGKCVSVCPVSLDTPGLLDRLRSEQGLSPAPRPARVLLDLVEDQRLLRRAGRLLRIYQRSGLKKAVRLSGLLRPLGLAPAEALLPKRPAAAHLPAVIPAKGEERARVAFFRGCLMDELLGSVNRDTVEVLARNGCRVRVPQDQVCCGAMHGHTSELDLARALARANIAAFDEDDLIVTNSGGCGAHMKAYGDLLADDPAWSERAEAFAARVRDFAEYLVELGPRPVPALPPVLVSYHDSCHLALVQGVTEPPRELLRAIPGVELIEMARGEACCGSGGTWGLRHPELSQKLRAEKLEDAVRTGAEVLVTNNPGCLLHLQDRELRSAHLAEILADAYRQEGE